MSWKNWFKTGIGVAETVLGVGSGSTKLGLAVSIVQAIAAAAASKGQVAVGEAHDMLAITTGVQDTFTEMKANHEIIGVIVAPGKFFIPSTPQPFPQPSLVKPKVPVPFLPAGARVFTLEELKAIGQKK